jgi:hypothetical protein
MDDNEDGSHNSRLRCNEQLSDGDLTPSYADGAFSIHQLAHRRSRSRVLVKYKFCQNAAVQV